MSVHRFSCELVHAGYGMGYIRINYDSRDQGDGTQGLWIDALKGYKRFEVGKENMAYLLRFPSPSQELLIQASLCSLGIMPPEIFADWLEDHEDSIKPQLDDFGEGRTLDIEWRGVLSEIRRFATEGAAT